MTTITHHTPTTREIAAMSLYALDLARAYPSAPAHALADKLLTVFEGTERSVRMTVAITACDAVQSLLAA